MESFEYPFFQHSVKVVMSEQGLLSISWQKKKLKKQPTLTSQQKKVARVLDDFLVGKTDLKSLPIDWKNLQGTDFQKSVWKKMFQIPWGKTRSYGEIAHSLKKPGAARAVGTACGKNPVLLAIPCHRVVGTSGLGGFSGGGLSVKRQLLELEGHSL